MPRLASHHVIAEATGELALGAVHLAVQVVALHVADYLAVQVQLVQVAAAVIQMVDLASIRQGQRGQVAKRVVLVAQGSIGSDFLSQPAQQVVGVFQLLFGYTQLLAGHVKSRLKHSNKLHNLQEQHHNKLARYNTLKTTTL
ncbi:hypothetical protein D3C84_922030 [compost metagenome]